MDQRRERRIGVLLMQRPGKPFYAYIDSEVHRWLKSAGATVVPIPSTVTPAEAAAYFEYVHGLFLHPGWADQPDYADRITLFLNMAIEANKAGEYFPVWGTCQGFQRIIQQFGGHLEPLDSRKFMKGSTIVVQVDDRQESRLLRYASANQFTHLKHDYIPYFNHGYGISLSAFMKCRGLRDSFRILSTSHDREGKEYISMIEGTVLPFYGVQYHPEKNAAGLEWMADFLVSELRKSTHTGFHPGTSPTLKPGTCEASFNSPKPCLRTP